MVSENHEKLVTLDELGKSVAGSDDDIRGRKVIDRDGNELGKIEALLVDQKDLKVRFLQLESGGFLGFGERKSLIPVDLIVSIEEHKVHIDQTGATVAAAPAYDPAFVDPRFYQDIYGHFGIPAYWELGYTYPTIRTTRSAPDGTVLGHRPARDGGTG
jgi:sporulation protein YlmC with PRC-barrel domain